jgi:peptide/nickel transport system permease protein
MTAVTLPRLTQRVPRRRRPRQSDWALVAGAAFFGALVLLAIYGPLIAPHDLYYSQALKDGKAPPFSASAEFPLGSDILGRDRLSWLLIGARGSVLIALGAAALRVLIGGSLGLVAGFRGGVLAGVLRRVALGVSSVPATIATLLAVIALGLDLGQFMLAIGLIGWAEPFHQARRYSRSESARPFMESARSLGLSDRRLLFRHLLPNVAPQLLTTAAFQVSAVLLLTAELALLNIFAGGAVLLDYDSHGNAIVAPRVPNWASMLAATRPIVSLYGDLASILLPGAALLGAALATNVFGDALAARAQRLDVYRLFSRPQIAGLAAVTALIALSVSAWPSRLAAEIEYARSVDVGSAQVLARELAALGPRPNGSAPAAVAADLLAHRMGGAVVSGQDTITRARSTALAIAGLPVVAEAISLDDADVRGKLVYLSTAGLFSGRRAPDAVTDAIVLLDAAAPPSLQRLVDTHARAVILLQAINLSRVRGVYPLPIVSASRQALTAALGRAIPDLRTSADRSVVLAEEARLQIQTEEVTTAISDVVARVASASTDAPVVLIAARYDAAPDATSTWDTASAAAMLALITEHLRAHPLPLTIVALASSGDHQNYAGLRFGLTQLTPSERDRLQAILLIGPMLSGSVVVETQTVQGQPSGMGRLAARLDDALGTHLSPQPLGDLTRAIFSKVSAAQLTFVGRGADHEPSAEDLRRSAVVVLTAVAYIPPHQSEMR